MADSLSTPPPIPADVQERIDGDSSYARGFLAAMRYADALVMRQYDREDVSDRVKLARIVGGIATHTDGQELAARAAGMTNVAQLYNDVVARGHIVNGVEVNRDVRTCHVCHVTVVEIDGYFVHRA